MPASRATFITGIDAGGHAYGGEELLWFCVNKDCPKYKQAVEPTWVEVAAFLPGQSTKSTIDDLNQRGGRPKRRESCKCACHTSRNWCCDCGCA